MKKKKLVLTATFSICCMVFWSICSPSKGKLANDLFLSNVEALTSPSDEDKSCIEGGIGASSCSIEAGITILGNGVTVGCSTECQKGYYACCALRCKCKPNPKA